MKSQELMSCINGGSIIFTEAEKFLNSSIAWFDDNIEPSEWIVEILRPDDIYPVMVTFVRVEEFNAKVYITDFSESIKSNDEEKFLKELCDNCEIFAEKHPQRYTNL